MLRVRPALPGLRNARPRLRIDQVVVNPLDELAAVFATAGVDPAVRVVVSCGSGVTDGIIALALAVLGRTDAAVYDGSWSEWGGDHRLPIETGPGR